MQTLAAITPLRAQLKSWRLEGKSIGFVPTMGNLHAGHLTLVQLARARADRVVVSVFVNPTQFKSSQNQQLRPKPLLRGRLPLSPDLLVCTVPASSPLQPRVVQGVVPQKKQKS